ncbi:hypothetical protein D3C76_1303760 [compost metagenome]
MTVISSAPAMALRLMLQPDSVPPPNINAAIKPTPAPLETPSSPGSASGFSNNACMIVPHRASDAPTSKTATVRGKRICQTNSLPCSLIQLSGPIHCSPAQRLTVKTAASNARSTSIQRRSERCC